MNPIDEILFQEETRNTIFPILYPTIWESYTKQRSCHWLPHEVSLKNDLNDWVKLDSDEQYFIKMILAFFASSDLIVNENIEKRFVNDVKLLEAKFTYDFQKSMENIHSEMYALLIDTLITNEKEKDYLFNAVKNIPIIKKMALWADKWINSDLSVNNYSYAERLVAFSAFEGILFSGPFCAIFWLKQRGILPGLCISNDFISRDERLHVEFGITLYKLLQKKLSSERFHEIIKEAVDLECEFITEALSCKLIGMNPNDMKQYIKFVANRLAEEYGYPNIYDNIVNPFNFMDQIGLSSKKNFFEIKPTEYKKSDILDEDISDLF
jgi:ribonucleotide reductase beta subunit family protein with ferritin-like domain